MTSQEEVARQFAKGEHPDNIDSASNFMCVEAEVMHCNAVLLSYGWAIVFGRRENGEIVEFTGWRGYSSSTSTQMGKARRAIQSVTGEEPRKVNKQPVADKANRLNHRVSRVIDHADNR